jgi:hypothetical protein
VFLDQLINHPHPCGTQKAGTAVRSGDGAPCPRALLGWEVEPPANLARAFLIFSAVALLTPASLIILSSSLSLSAK